MKLAMSGLVLVAMVGPAAAQPATAGSAAAEPAAAAGPAAAVTRPAQEQYSEGTALALSLGVTAGSYALAALSPYITDTQGTQSAVATVAGIGIVFGPSAGHVYANRQLWTRGLGMRGAGIGIALLGLIAAIDDCVDSELECDGSGLATALAVGGAGLFVAGTIDDIVTAPRSARRANQRQGVAVAPVMTKDSVGVAIGGRF